MADQDHIASRDLEQAVSGARVPADPVFVFGSNLAGRHGKGAALWARQQRGAVYGQGIGLQGNSYAIPTKDERMRTLPLDEIKVHVESFLWEAHHRPDLSFQLTPIGCGLAGYAHGQIAPMFADAPPNVILPDEFRAALGMPAASPARPNVTDPGTRPNPPEPDA